MRPKAILYVALGLSLLVSLGMARPSHAQATCGGIGALKCPADQACRYETGKCNAPDLAGVCVPVPATCPTKGPKVCGCDDKTYANECELLKAGVREAKKGACPKPKPSSAAHPAAASPKSS